MNTLSRKVFVATFAVLLLLIGGGVLIAIESSQWNDKLTYVMRDYQRALLDGEFNEALTRATGETAAYLLSGVDDYRVEAGEALERAKRSVAVLRKIADEGPAEAGDLSHLRFLERQEQLLQLLQAEFDDARSGMSKPLAANPAAALSKIYAHEATADSLWQETIAHHTNERLENEQALRSYGRRVGMLVLASAAVFALWIGLVIGYVRQRVVRPLTDLARMSAAIATGDLTQSVAVTNGDEIGQLQRSFNLMVEQLAEQRCKMTALIDSLNRSRDAAESASRAKSIFLAKVSHEIRTPMNGVMFTLDLMHETASTRKQRDLADMARASARNLLRMVNDLLDLSRIEAGKLELESVAFDPRQLVTQKVALHGKRAMAKGLATSCNIGAGVPKKLYGDKMRLGQILLNLLDNAIKFTERGSIEVAVTVDAPGPLRTQPQVGAKAQPVWLRFRVTDSGIGVPAEAAEKIFQPFYSGEGSANEMYQYHGLGLGLDIARQLVRGMGGELGFESEVGKGSSFWFTVPLMPEAQSNDVTTEAEAEATPRQLPAGSRVLVAEDHRDTRDVMAWMLKRRNLSVTTAENGRRALDLVAEQSFDLILMDCQMPEMDGFEATRAIRALGGDWWTVPIVALTAYGLAGEKQRFFDAGFDDMLTKPYTVEQIEEVAYRWLVLERQHGVLRSGAEAESTDGPTTDGSTR